MNNPHEKRRSRWLEEADVIEFDNKIWVDEDYVYTLLDRELAFERKRNASLFCSHCKKAKPFRDRETNSFMHEIYIEENSRMKSLKRVPCYADAIWRNEDQ
jgi:hypothetical protein